MSNQDSNIINPFTPPGLDSIKSQFAAAQQSDSPVVNESIILGHDGKPVSSSPEPTPAEEPAPNVKFYPFPKSGNILAALEHPETPGTIALCVNVAEGLEPKPLCVAITRIVDVAHMICDGVNYMFKATQILKQDKESGLCAPAVDASSTKVD
jgi:hypothetical protein